jgi:hypothetical protein
MKTTQLSILLTVAFLFTMPIHAQHHHGEMLKKEKKESSMKDVMGPATYEKSQDGVHIAVWLITQEEHKKIMQDRMKDGKHMMQMDHGMMHDSKDTSKGEHMMKMDHGMMHDSKDTSKGEHMMHDMEGMDHEAKSDSQKTSMDAMMAGTHHIMVTVTDEKSKEEMNKAEVFVTATSPAKKSSTITLSRMMNHLGGALAMDEKGTYTVKAAIKTGDKHFEAQFSYEVK